MRRETIQQKTRCPKFDFWGERKVAEHHIEKFWQKWEKLRSRKDRAKKLLTPDSYWTREVLALSPAMPVTVRRFRNAEDAKSYIKRTTIVENEIIAANPRHFRLCHVQFFGIRGPDVIERVYTAPDLNRFRDKKARYYIKRH